MTIRAAFFAATAFALAAATTNLSAQPATPSQVAAPERPVFQADGTVRVPAFDLRPSAFLSPEALEAQKARARPRGGLPAMSTDIADSRRWIEEQMAPQVAAMRRIHPVDIAEQRIGGVRVRVVTPQGQPVDSERVLINLHGGAFTVCADGCALLESVPIASIGRFKVITVDYRMAPEASHPAGVEDVVTVYRELLKSYRPKQIGIYGCSAGGALTGQTAAWLPANNLPQAGAVGIFGAGAVRFGAGDSAFIAGYVDGSFPPPPPPGGRNIDLTRGYFDGTDMDDPIVSPALHPDVIAKFPPTLIITGTRSMDMSPAIVTNSALIKARVPSNLIVGEGMGHCYIMQPTLPEARDAQQAIVDFFKANLGVPAAPD
jgi:monoterpene epsilon-lactone hydrolase